MKLNGLLASPSFAAWAEGPPLDIQSMLYTADGTPRCAIVTTAHLSDEERQFVTSLVLTKLVTWMRRQSGTTDLRALLYMDEVVGYLPPTANPPTKKPIMTLMKQARAFGVGVVLSTQNPVDVDYKALSNAGTWMIGRLQTERDKQRLLDGLQLGQRRRRRRRRRRHDLRARQARVRAAAGRQGLDRGVHHSLGDELPARPDDPRPDRGVMARRTPAGDAGDAIRRRRPEPQSAGRHGSGAGVRRRDHGHARGRRRDAGALGRRRRAVVDGRRRRSARRAGSTPAVVARVRLRYDDTKADLVHDDEYECVHHSARRSRSTCHRRSPSTTTTATCATSRRRRRRVPHHAMRQARTKTFFTAIERDLRDHLTRSLTARRSRPTPSSSSTAAPARPPRRSQPRCAAARRRARRRRDRHVA